jgi:hypothetical protein
MYASGWESFFDDFLALAGNSGSLGSSNVPATALYLRILGSVHDEIADVIIPRTPEEAKRNTELKDLVRARDAEKVSLSWQEILAKWRQIDLNVVEMCLRVVSRWVSWIDISLVVNQTVLQALLEMAGQQGLQNHASMEVKIRDAAIVSRHHVAYRLRRVIFKRSCSFSIDNFKLSDTTTHNVAGNSDHFEREWTNRLGFNASPFCGRSKYPHCSLNTYVNPPLGRLHRDRQQKDETTRKGGVTRLFEPQDRRWTVGC